MRYRRHEIIRYTFPEPRPATYQIVKVGGKAIHSSVGEGAIIDMSPGGMKLSTTVHISLEQTIQFQIQTTIANVHLSIMANGVWGKKVGKNYHYGLDFLDNYNEEVVQALKAFRKQMK